MLNIHEVKVHNLKVERKREERLLKKLEECPGPMIGRDAAGRSTLPKIDPAARVWKRPPHVAKARNRVKVAIATQASNYPVNYLREYLRGERD